MKTAIESGDAGLVLTLMPDDMDAIPTVPAVWFRFDRPLEIDTHRLGLLAYIVSYELVGTTFSLEGASLPPYMASLLQQDFPGHELLISGVDNVPRAITKEPKFESLTCEISGSSDETVTASFDNRDGQLIARRSKLGFEVFDGQKKRLLEIRTNLLLHAATASREPVAMIESVLYLITFDKLCPRVFHMTSKGCLVGKHFARWIREAGGEIA